MSCYFRHLKEVFAEAGIEVNSTNRKEIDQAIHRLVDTDYKDCPGTWKKVKEKLADERQRKDFIRKLRNAVK
ncbi:MAG: hypothetical protein V1767_03875 [Chloroflexota bacterium]